MRDWGSVLPSSYCRCRRIVFAVCVSRFHRLRNPRLSPSYCRHRRIITVVSSLPFFGNRLRCLRNPSPSFKEPPSSSFDKPVLIVVFIVWETHLYRRRFEKPVFIAVWETRRRRRLRSLFLSFVTLWNSSPHHMLAIVRSRTKPVRKSSLAYEWLGARRHRSVLWYNAYPPTNTQAQASGVGVRSPLGPDNVYKKSLLEGNIKIDRLGEHNYQEWSETVELYLSAKLLFVIVDGSIPSPDKITWPNDYEAWKFDDKEAKTWIYANCEQTQKVHLHGTKSSHSSQDQGWQRFK